MRIVQLLPELNEGGVERGVVELSRELVVRGYESVVISAGGSLVAAIEADGGTHICHDVCSKNPLTFPLRMMLLRDIFRKIRPDVIHARSRIPAWLAMLANGKLHVPFVTTVHGFNSVSLYSRVMTFGDRVICVSNPIRDYVVQHYRVPNDKLVVIPRGIDLELFNPERLDQQFTDEFRRRFGLEGKFVVSSVGRITQLKDYETFISGLALLRKTVPNVVGLIVGGVRDDKNDYFGRLQQQVAAEGVADIIHFTGSQRKVAEIYALSDVVVSSSKKPESFGRSAAEALAMNVPVVATGHGGMLDIVIPGISGQLFNPEDPAGLAESILACRQMDRSGLRQFVADRFTLERMVEATLAVYREVTGNQVPSNVKENI